MNIPILRYFKRNQIVVLLGAGATYPWDGVKSQSIMNEFKKDAVGGIIYELLLSFYDGEKERFNFETFLAAIEEILNFIMASTNENKYVSNSSFRPSILQLKNEINVLLKDKDEIEKRKYWCNLFRRYIDIIIKEIDGYNNNVLEKKYDKINNQLIEFTRYFRKRNYAVKFYTTNYDNLIPQILGKHFNNIYEGFCRTSDSYKRFDYDLSKFRKARLSHFNLHGSIFLRKMLMQSPEIKYETVYDLSRQNIYSNLNENSGNTGELLLFSPIITGYNKTQRISNTPFNLGFHAFCNDCNDCRALITVGYSFSDPHINSIISTFTKWDKTILLDVNPYSELQNKDYFISQIIKSEENKTWLHGNNGKKHIYKKGFDDFLSDKKNWKYLIL